MLDCCAEIVLGNVLISWHVDILKRHCVKAHEMVVVPSHRHLGQRICEVWRASDALIYSSRADEKPKNEVAFSGMRVPSRSATPDAMKGTISVVAGDPATLRHLLSSHPNLLYQFSPH
jgi:hypothetical protein